MRQFPATVCSECETLFAYPVAVCRECGAESLDRRLIAGTGTVYARTTIRVPGSEHEGKEPFEICVVDVGERDQVRVTVRVLDNPQLEPGDHVVFDDEREGVFYFRAPEE